jgi:arylsulfatase A-like enzyme
VNNIPPYFPDDPIIREDMAINYSNLVRMDTEIGAIINELKAQGLYDNSYIFFYSDHGGPFPRHKRAIYDSGVKVPLMIKLPKNAKAGNRNDDLWSFVDLAPTVLQLAQIPLPDYLQGMSILDKKTKPRKYLVTASDRFDGQVDRIRSIKTKRYKLIKNYNVSLPHALEVNYRKKMPMMRRLMELNEKGLLNKNAQRWFETPKPEMEFYDLKKDPFELNNLANKASHNTKLRQFNNLLEAWINDTGDLGNLPEQEIIDYSTN